MDKRNGFSVQQRRTIYDSEGSELDESCLIEERLKSLMSANRRELMKTRNIFSDFKEQIPKLRRSIVVRALKDIVSSTPIVTGNKETVFHSEASINISPIGSISTALEHCRNNKDVEKKVMSHIHSYYIKPDTPFKTAVNRNKKRSHIQISKKLVVPLSETSKVESKSDRRTNLSSRSQFESVKRRRQASADRITKNSLSKALSKSTDKIEIDKEDLTERNRLSQNKYRRENLTPADLGYPESLTSATAGNSCTIIRQRSKSHSENMDSLDNKNRLELNKIRLRFSENTTLDQTSGVSSNNVSADADKNMPDVYPITSLIAEISERKNQSLNATKMSKKNIQSILDSISSKFVGCTSRANDSKTDLKQKETVESNSDSQDNKVDEMVNFTCFEQRVSSEMSPREHHGSINRVDHIDRVVNFGNSSETLGQSVVKVEDTPKPKRIVKKIRQKPVDDSKSIIVKTNSGGCTCRYRCRCIDKNANEILTVPSKNEEVFLGEEKLDKAVNKKYEKRINNVEKAKNISHKVPKSLQPKHLKKATNNGVMMENPDKPTALRRSERTRRPPLRRICYGVVVTYSERVFYYYNGSSQKPVEEISELCLLNVKKPSKQQTTKNSTRNKPNGREKGDPEKKTNRSNGKKGRKPN